MGTLPCTPSAGPPQPRWETATTTPYEAAMDRTFRTAAFTATSRPRKTVRSSPTTTCRYPAISHISSSAALTPTASTPSAPVMRTASPAPSSSPPSRTAPRTTCTYK